MQNGWSPLIRASNEGNVKLVKIIANRGGEINHQTKVPYMIIKLLCSGSIDTLVLSMHC